MRGSPREASALLCGVCLVLGGVSHAAGQHFTGGVRGLVRDTEGVSTGATVTLAHQDTGTQRRTVTNDRGQYAFVAVPPGTYSVQTSLPGHRTVVRRGIEIGTQQFVTLDLLLEVGAPEDRITVTGDAPSIETANASVATVLDRVMLNAWPSPNRDPFVLAVTVPTVVSVGDRRFTLQREQTDSSLISIGGGGIRANNYILDGVPISDLRGRSLLSPTIEAIQDVKIQVHTYDAEVGRTGGGVFNTTARAGTNAFHGSGFFQTRPVWGQSLDFFDAQRELTQEDVGLTGALHRVYGGGGGGPIWRNHTFFWAASESYHARRLVSAQELWPTARQRVGDFSTTTVDGEAVRIFNPYCRSGIASARCPDTGPSGTLVNPEFANAIIPAFALNPVALNMAAVWPLPNQGNEDTEPNAIGSTQSVDEADMVSFKIEHKFTDNWTLSGLIVYTETAEQAPFLMEQPIADTLDRNSGVKQRRPRVLVFNDTNVLNDRTVLTVRAGGTSFSRRVAPGSHPGGPQALGFSSTFVNAIDPAGRSLFPGLVFENFTNVGKSAGEDERWEQPYAVNASLSRLAGRHAFKIGGDARRLSGVVVTERFIAGTFAFNRNFTRGPGPDRLGGYDFASFLAGAPRRVSRAPFNRGSIEVFTRYFGAYFQDDWRVSPNLTINYGVRLEREDGLQEVDNRFTVGFDQEVVNPLDALVPASARVGTPLEGRTIRGGLIFAGVDGANTHQGDPPAVKVSPRLGLTYAFDDRTVIRGGYGLFWAPWNYSATNHGQIGFTRTTSVNQGSDTREAPLTTLDDPFPNGLEALRSGARWGCSPVPAPTSISWTRPKALRRSISTPVRSSTSCPGGSRSRSATSAPPGGTSDSVEPTTPGSTSIRSRPRLRWPSFPRKTIGGIRRRCSSRSRTRFSASPKRANSRTRRRFSAASCCDRSRSSATSTRENAPKAASVSTSRRVQPRQAHRVELLGWAPQLHPQRHEGQPVRSEQCLPGPDGGAAEQLRSRGGVRHEQFRFTLSDHPGAAVQVSGSRREQFRTLPLGRLDGGGDRPVDERRVAERRGQRRALE